MGTSRPALITTRAPRVSRYLKPRGSTNFAAGVNHASDIDRPLNWFVTINYGLVDCSAEQMSAAFERLRDNHFCKWFTRSALWADEPRQRGAPTYAWVAEGRPGHHGIHWMVHLPAALSRGFQARLEGW